MKKDLEPIFITKITDPHGKVLEEFEAPSDPVIAPETARRFGCDAARQILERRQHCVEHTLVHSHDGRDPLPRDGEGDLNPAGS